MASQPPEDAVTAVEVKDSDPARSTPNATTPQSTAAPSTLTSLPKKDVEVINNLLARLTNHKDEYDHEVAAHFQRIVSKRVLPDYYEIIKEPMAFSTIRGKLIKKQYQHYRDFVRDFAVLLHNAKVYNRPSAEVYQDSSALGELFKAELQKLVNDKVISSDDAELPDLGPLPEVEASPPPDPNAEEEVEEDEVEEEEEEEDEDTDDDRPRRRGAKKGRRSSAVAKREKGDDGGKEDPDATKKRGRPPKVHTPMEARINALLKGLRKFKNLPGGDLKILPFERLPDKTLMPEYYKEIQNPIAMDLIKRKAKRKKYNSVDHALRDLELMFENAKKYNEDDSQVYKDAVELQKEARIIAEQEKKKPDTDFVDEDGRLPLLEILHNGKVWKVGDWIHLANPNDVTKPIVAQIYRTWQDTSGQKWINACWYYRPEQTVHRFEKMFFENEVVKTGQYRDHKIEEVVDECFVMFFTRYNKGRPRNFPPDKEVYVCEARYNEEKFKLNKIKTWASCVPDEVRDKDYEMDLFDTPRMVKKVQSPIRHLLRDDAKEDDPLPRPTWGAPNAPPIVGAVHRRPREPNDTPPPSPTPSPPPPEPEPVRRPTTSDRSRYDPLANTSSSNQNAPLPSPSANQMPSQPQYNPFPTVRPSASPSPSVHTSNPYGSHNQSSYGGGPQTPLHAPSASYGGYAPSPTPVPHQSSVGYGSNSHQSFQSPQARPVQQLHHSHSRPSNTYDPPKQEVYRLEEHANQAIGRDIASQFLTDENGHILFFTAPPLNVEPLPEDKQKLSHSLEYLADKERNKISDSAKRSARQAELEHLANAKAKCSKTGIQAAKDGLVASKLGGLKEWTEKMNEGTDALYKHLEKDDWKSVKDANTKALAEKQMAAKEAQKKREEFLERKKKRGEVKISKFKF